MHRIRVSLLLPRSNQLLFVSEVAEARHADLDIDPERAGFWQLPGGGLEPGESVYAAAVREAREETSLVVRPERIVYVQEYVNPLEPFFQIEFIVVAAVRAGRPAVQKHDQVTGARFLARSDRHAFNIAPWHDRATIWTDLERHFPYFRHLGVDAVQAGQPRRAHSEPFKAVNQFDDDSKPSES